MNEGDVGFRFLVSDGHQKVKLGLSGSHGTPGSTRPLAEAPVHLGREVLRRRGERRGVLAHGRLHGPLVELRIDGRGARRRGRRGGLGRRDRRRLEGLDGRRGGGLHLRVPTIKELDGELCRLCNRAALTLQGADFAKPAGLGCLDLQSSPILRAQRRRGAGWTNRRPGFASLCRPGSRFALSQKFRFFGVTAVNHQLFGRHRTQTLTFKAASATSTFKLSHGRGRAQSLSYA